MKKLFKVLLACGLLLGATQVFGWNEGAWNEFALALKKLKYDIIPQTTGVRTLGDSSHYFLSAYITSLNTTNYVVADGGYVGLGAAKGRFVFDDETQDTISALTCDMIFGSATVDTGTITMIKGAQTSDPQVQFALSADANGNFSITADTGDITLTAADDVFLTATGGALTIDAVNAAADSTVTITNSNGTYKADLSIEGAVSYDEADWTGGNVIYVPLSTGTSMEDALNAAITAATAGDTLLLAAGTWVIDGAVVCGKKVHLKGQGRGITTIYSTADISMITNTATAGTLISDMTISHAGAVTGTSKAMISLSFPANINNVEFLNAATGSDAVAYPCIVTGVGGAGTAGTSNIENCTATLTGEIGLHEFLYNGLASSVVNIKNCVATSNAITSPVAGYGSGIIRTNVISTTNLYNCNFTNPTNTTSGVINIIGSVASVINAYNCYINGSGATGFDVKNASGSATLTLSNCTLANNTTSGTITYAGNNSQFKGGNTYFLPAGLTAAQVDAYCDAATDGDTLILAAATYPTWTTSVTPSKNVRIRGMGVGRTILTSTVVGQMFNYAGVSGAISNLSINFSPASGTGYAIYFDGKDVTGNVENVDFTVAGAAGARFAVGWDEARGFAKNLTGTITSADLQATAILVNGRSTGTAANQVDAYNCNFNCIAQQNANNAVYSANDNSNAQNTVLNLYDCYGTHTGLVSSMGLRSYGGAKAFLNAYGGRYSAVQYDAVQANSASLTLSNVVLANNTTSGSITYRTWTAWTPTLTWATGTPASVTTVARYTVTDGICHFTFRTTSADSNGCTGLTVTLPITPKDINTMHAVTSRQLNDATWLDPMGYIDMTDDTPANRLLTFHGFATVADGATVTVEVSGEYEI